MAGGVLSISFDFEMAWGTRRNARDLNHAQGVERVREVVRGLLDIFIRHRISATWATVGHLMLRPEDCPDGRFPKRLPAPSPDWFSGEWYDGIPSMHEQRGLRYYAPDLVEAIVNCPVHQELASHTFSHVVIGEDACTREVAQAEFDTCREIAQRWGREIRSLVFPRNKVGHLDVLRETGHTCFRGPNSEWFLLGTAAKPIKNRLLSRLTANLVRVLRFVDESLVICPPLGKAKRVEGLWELPHSMFFPGCTGLSKFVPRESQVQRATMGMQKAAKLGRIFSLYTHPHNFLPDVPEQLEAFEQICIAAARLRDAGEIEIKTMEEIAHDLSAGRNLHWAA
ncbi:hypothetical protein LBMAG52_30010 [Planctomycetia bacterium]|nr:hypothetical protein LBMAG52_30010 [Planctomycetia bacterium]